MKFFIQIIIAILIFAFSHQLFAQETINKNEIVNKEFWLKVPIPTESECKMMISPEGIHSPKDYCKYDYYDEYIFDEKKVKIINFGKRKKWTKVKFSTEDNENPITIYLRGNSKKTLKESFNLVFSGKVFDLNGFYSCEKIKTKLDVFKKFSFPSSISKNKNGELYEYGLEFGGNVCGFDITTIKIQDEKVFEISGSI